jgi:RNA-binding protein PNO1
MESNRKYSEEMVITDTIQTGNNIGGENLMSIDTELLNEKKTNLLNKNVKQEYRRVMVPANRMKPLKENWPTIVKALVEHMKIQVKMNTKIKCVELRTCEQTEEVSALQKSQEFLKSFMCGFDIQDSIAMLRLEDLYLETFEIKDGKYLNIKIKLYSKNITWRPFK